MIRTSHSTTAHHASHFGFSFVQEAAKEGMVQAVFDRVAGRYDLMNDAMSLGVHHHWKDRLMDTLRPTPDMRLLDVAGGTGDVAFRFLVRGGAHATVCDLNAEMLKVGQGRAIDRNLDAARLSWVHGNAEALPFCHSERSEESHPKIRDTSASPQYDNFPFDAYTISFGIRNVTHLDKALSEAYRVLKRGGRFLCLEFSTPPNAWLKKMYDAYSLHMIPKMGEVLTGDAPSYQYLVESIRQFPSPDDFAALIRTAGFDNVSYQRLSAGVVAIHSGWKL